MPGGLGGLGGLGGRYGSSQALPALPPAPRRTPRRTPPGCRGAARPLCVAPPGPARPRLGPAPRSIGDRPGTAGQRGGAGSTTASSARQGTRAPTSSHGHGNGPLRGRPPSSRPGRALAKPGGPARLPGTGPTRPSASRPDSSPSPHAPPTRRWCSCLYSTRRAAARRAQYSSLASSGCPPREKTQ